jgi:hypothetical protein
MLYDEKKEYTPTIPDVRHSREVVERWYHSACHRNKTSAIHETKRLLEILDYLEKRGGLRQFNHSY